MASAAVNIDGSLMEGGGQVLRVSAALAVLLRKPTTISNVRGKRSKPGLQAQHVTGLRLLRDIGSCSAVGLDMNSTRVELVPAEDGRVAGGAFEGDTRTAGAVTLLAQACVPCLVFGASPSVLRLRGGTNAIMAPQVDYYENVFLPCLGKFGIECHMQVKMKGYYPKGGGEVHVEVNPVESLRPIELLSRGTVCRIRIAASVAGALPVRVAEEMAEAARHLLSKRLRDLRSVIEVSAFKEQSAFGNGSSICIWAETSAGCVLGGSAIGSPKVKPAETGASAAEELLSSLESGACADQWLQDQLIIFMALARGTSRVRTGPLTLHTQTAISICQQMSAAKFQVVEDSATSTFIIECEGIGLVRGAEWA